MFGVIVCPKCQHPRGIRLSSRKTKCPRCGAVNDVATMRIYFISDSEKEVGEAIRSAAIQLHHDDRRLPDFDINSDVRITVARVTGKLGRDSPTREEIEDITLQLILDYGCFTLQGFEEILQERYPRYTDRIVEALKREGGSPMRERMTKKVRNQIETGPLPLPRT